MTRASRDLSSASMTSTYAAKQRFVACDTSPGSSKSSRFTVTPSFGSTSENSVVTDQITDPVTAFGDSASEQSRGEQAVSVCRVQFLSFFGEPELGQHTARSGVPLPDRGPQPFVPRRSRPVQNR